MPNPIIVGLLAIIAAPGMLQGLNNSFPPYAALMARRGYKDRPSLIPSADELVGLRMREVISAERYHALMREGGFDAKISDQLMAGAKSYMTALDYITLWRRGDTTELETDDQLGKLGYDDRQIKLVKQVTLYYPTAQDIVRFAVRDVYTPTTVEAYGLMSDMPPDYLPAAAKAGLAEETGRAFWAAHWELPSPTQVFEMLHRGIITEEETEQYLKSADYMPRWRKPLMDISYNPLTRVDVQRMFRMGVLGEDEVYKSYRAIGYNDTNAKYMTEFTVKMAAGKEDETPKSVIMQAYDAGLIDADKAREQLKALHLTDEAIETVIALANDAILQEKIDLQADSIIDHFNQGGISQAEMETQLTTIGVPARMLQLTIQRELAQAKKRKKVATKADLDRWLKYGLLPTEQYDKRMSLLGYSASDIAMYQGEAILESVMDNPKKLRYAPLIREYLSGPVGTADLVDALMKLDYDRETATTIAEVARGMRG